MATLSVINGALQKENDGLRAVRYLPLHTLPRSPCQINLLRLTCELLGRPNSDPG